MGIRFQGAAGLQWTIRGRRYAARVVSGNFQDIVKTFTNTPTGNVRLVAPGGLTSRTITYTELCPAPERADVTSRSCSTCRRLPILESSCGDDLGAGANTSQIAGSTFETRPSQIPQLV